MSALMMKRVICAALSASSLLSSLTACQNEDGVIGDRTKCQISFLCYSLSDVFFVFLTEPTMFKVLMHPLKLFSLSHILLW